MTSPEIVPFALLLLSGVGFVLNLIADGWPHERRLKLGITLIIVACCAVLVMK